MFYINGRPVNPLISLLVTAAVIAGSVGLFILLLPFLGTLLLVLLAGFAGLVAYGAWYRWRHGDPMQELQKRMAQRAAAGFTQTAQGEPETSGAPADAGATSQGRVNGDRARVGVRRTVEVEDVQAGEVVRRRE